MKTPIKKEISFTKIIIWVFVFVPMAILSNILPDLFFNAGSTLHALSFLGFLIVGQILFAKICFKGGGYNLLRIINFFGCEIAIIAITIYFS